ncbi:MAG: hypothetical protein J6T24_05935 [Clostridia bacterium]|nr:hypothetical protein [Clostridia bacterium]
MKTVCRRALALLLLAALLAVLSGCYVVSPQPMRRVKGTYRLVDYTVTPAHERREGYTPPTRDYVAGEGYLYTDYLVISGDGTGYYVHKTADGPAYVRQISLSFEYGEESSRIAYVILHGVTVGEVEGGIDRLGVTRDRLGYSKAAFDYTEPFTKLEKRTEGITLSFERVSGATDPSYVEKQLGTLTPYEN